jgi:Fur family peroxide stress response transcriptional regulator
VEELHRRLLVKFPTISLDTVYRTLGTLARHGLVHKIESVESHARYEVRGVPHHHLICRRCKEIVDFQWASFEEAALPDELKAWGRIEDRNVVVYGLCRECEGKKE